MTPRNQAVSAGARPARPVLYACAIALSLAGVMPLTQAADHLEAPGVMGRGDVDLNDLFVFQSPNNADNAVLALTVNPFAGQLSGTQFNEFAAYEFLIDNDGDAMPDITYRTTFSAASGGLQTLTATRGTASGVFTPYAVGHTGQNITTADSGLLRADLFDDPFFFDLVGFRNGFAFTGSDAFAGANVSAIVLELPSAELGGPNIGVWARTVDPGDVQVDRVGRPAINTALIPTGEKDPFNQGEPMNDAAEFSDEVLASLTALSGDAALAGILTGILLPDVLTFDTTNPGGFLNGRQLTDDVIDAVLDLVSGGAVTSDGVAANDLAFAGLFPYLAAPHNLVTSAEPSTAMLLVFGTFAALAYRRRRKPLKSS